MPDDLERYENTEARHLLRLLRTHRPPPERPVPPDFRANVWRRIEQRRTAYQPLAGLAQLLSPIAVPALAIGLICSIGLNVWWGMQRLAPQAPDEQRAARSVPLWSSEAYTFLAAMPSTASLGSLVAAHTTLSDQPILFGFSPQAQHTKALWFRMGALYVEAMAALQSGDWDIAVERLEALKQTLDTAPVSVMLPQYIQTLQEQVQKRSGPPRRLAKRLALFEPLYATDTKDRDDVRLILFRIGMWVENILLAAAAGDMTALQQVQVVPQLRRELAALQAPHEALEALAEIESVMTQERLSDRDVNRVLRLTKRVQQRLG